MCIYICALHAVLHMYMFTGPFFLKVPCQLIVGLAMKCLPERHTLPYDCYGAMSQNHTTPAGSYHVPFIGYPVCGLGLHNYKAWYPNEGV